MRNAELIEGALPVHVAIIMDGNGRWAKGRNLPRTQGHIEGVKRVEETVEAAARIGIKILTLYTFSTENWRRPQAEVDMLMRTLNTVLVKKIKKLKDNNIRLQFLGSKEGIPSEVLKTMEYAHTETQNNTGMVLNMAFNYGARQEIVRAVRDIAQQVKEGKLSVQDINESLMSTALYTQGLADPDLLIRTSGERRISNFLLWQLSYAELYFTDVYWPDFNESEFRKAIEDFQNRERRYGKISVKIY